MPTFYYPKSVCVYSALVSLPEVAYLIAAVVAQRDGMFTSSPTSLTRKKFEVERQGEAEVDRVEKGMEDDDRVRSMAG